MNREYQIMPLRLYNTVNLCVPYNNIVSLCAFNVVSVLCATSACTNENRTRF